MVFSWDIELEKYYTKIEVNTFLGKQWLRWSNLLQIYINPNFLSKPVFFPKHIIKNKTWGLVTSHYGRIRLYYTAHVMGNF